MVVHRKILAMVSLTVFSLSAVTAANIKDINQAVNVAGKQRMLSFRILKDYLMISMESNYKNPKRDMAESINEFEVANKEIESYAPDAITKDKLSKLEKVFMTFKESVSMPFDKSSVVETVGKAAEVRIAAHKLTLYLTKLSNDKSGKIVNIAGRLRALSQKLASMYILETLGAGHEMAKEKIAQAMKTFRDSLDFLLGANMKHPKVEANLKKLENIYLFFQVMNESDNRVPTIVVKKSDKMLKYANEIVEIHLMKGNKK